MKATKVITMITRSLALGMCLILLSHCGRSGFGSGSNLSDNESGPDLFPQGSGSRSTPAPINPNVPDRIPTTVRSQSNEDDLREDFGILFQELSQASGSALNDAVSSLSLAIAALVTQVERNSIHVTNLVPLANNNSARISALEAGGGDLSRCRIAQSPVSSATPAVVECNANETAISGGVICETPNPGCGIGPCKTLGLVHASQFSGTGNGWIGSCVGVAPQRHAAQVAHVKCCRID